MFGKGRVRGLLLAGLLVAVAVCVTFACADELGPDYDVSVSLYRQSDNARRSLAQASLTLTSINVGSDVASVQALLLRSHIYADADAVSLIYALNPSLRDAQSLKPGETIRIAEVVETQEVKSALLDGFLFKIRYDGQMIAKVVNLRSDVHDTFDAHPIPDCARSVTTDFDQIVDHLEDRDQPTNHEMLSQIGSEVELLLQKLKRAPGENRALTSADQATVCAVAKDLSLKRQGFDNSRGDTSTFLRPPLARVLVNTYLNAAEHKAVAMLRIYYVPEALQDEPGEAKQFATLSSPAESELPEADYIFWAMKDGNPSPLSERIRVSVRRRSDSNPQPVEILVNQ
jgi:hypothetical protein